MIRTNRRALALLLVALAAVAAAVLAYGLRDRLTRLPMVGTFAGDDRTGPLHEPARAPAPGVPPADAPEPLGRGPLTLDLRRQQLIGVRTAPVERLALTRTIRTVGRVEYDETRLSEISLKLGGWIEELFVDSTGQYVRRGDPLFTIYSPELVATQNEYLLARTTRDQMQQSQIADAREYADRLVQAARRRLELWDLPPDQLQALEEARDVQRTMTFRSPVEGFVIEKRALRGMHVSPGEPLYRIADLSAVWVEGDVYESEMAALRQGQRVTVTVDAYPDERFVGEVAYIYPYVEEQTRTVRVRVGLPNPRGRLKPGMYGHMELEERLGTGLAVPTNALLDSGTRQYVFVSLGDGHFDPRRVRAGRRLGDTIQILDGLQEGEHVVTNAAFFIDSESQLRAALEGFEAPPAVADQAPAGERLQITYRSQPDPPRTGANTLEVTVLDPDDRPVTDADVSVIFFMPAMPAMNMPAMRTEARLEHVGEGMYRGSGDVLMGGSWDVTVQVTRGGERIGSRQFGVVAR